MVALTSSSLAISPLDRPSASRARICVSRSLSRGPSAGARSRSSPARADLHLRSQDYLTSGHDRHRLADLRGRALLREEPGRTHRQRLVDELAIDKCGQQDDPRAGALPPDGPQDLQTVQLRHLDIEHRNVGLVLADLRQGGASVGRLGDQRQLGPCANRVSQALTVKGMVLGDEDPNLDGGHSTLFIDSSAAVHHPIGRSPGGGEVTPKPAARAMVTRQPIGEHLSRVLRVGDPRTR